MFNYIVSIIRYSEAKYVVKRKVLPAIAAAKAKATKKASIKSTKEDLIVEKPRTRNAPVYVSP